MQCHAADIIRPHFVLQLISPLLTRLYIDKILGSPYMPHSVQILLGQLCLVYIHNGVGGPEHTHTRHTHIARVLVRI